MLQQRVSGEGLVDYKALQAHPEKLFSYVESLAKRSPDNAPELFPSEAHRLAHWINAYNALTAENLEWTLQQATVEFLNNPANVRIHPEQTRVELSAYFKGFDADFLRWLRQKRTARPERS